MFDKAFKSTVHTFICDPEECDTMVEVTTSDRFGFPSGVIKNTCPCGRQMQYISAKVVDNPTIERQEMITENIVTYGDTERIQAQEVKIQMLEADKNRYFDKMNSLQSKINKIIDNLTDEYWYSEGTDKEEVLAEVCEIVEHNPIKTFTFSGTITFEGSVDIPMDELEDFDLHYFLQDELSLDSHNGNLEINTFDVDHVRED